MPLGKINFFGPIGKWLAELKDISSPVNMINKGISIAIGLATSVAFIYFMFHFFMAGISWLSAGGDQKRVESAGKQIYNAIIGLIIVVAAMAITQLIGGLLGIDVANPFAFLLEVWK